MALKATEIGKLVVYATSFDLSANTSLEIVLKDPAGNEVVVPDARITAPAAPLNTSLGLLPASTYMQFSTLATDFPQKDDFTICGTYFAVGKKFFGDIATIPVAAAC